MRVELQHQQRGKCVSLGTVDISFAGVPRQGDPVEVDDVSYVVQAVFWKVDREIGVLVPSCIRLK